ncbi:MAG: S8 family serine peptidase [Saprospiraceae bacterium]|nr:S8 family serine peptidase [Saprospiraceae bacterium]
MIKRFLLLSVLFLPIFLSGQIIQNEFVLEFHHQNIQKHIQDLSGKLSVRQNLFFEVAPFSNHPKNEYYTLKVDMEASEEWYHVLLHDKNIINVERAAVTENRNTRPNDPQLVSQWYLETIKAFDAWSITKGGPDLNGNEIVIAILDDGFLLSHEDFADIFYTNPGEIPGDGIDNDANGFIDDVNGFNFDTNNGTITAETHGTQVLGAAAAKGNNGRGISGINWNAKVMLCQVPLRTTEVQKAYDYVFKMKSLYLESGGTKGANIVTVSYSAGVANRFGSEFPVWCSLYDKMGEKGILSVGACPNSNDNIDVVGDVPSTCESKYLIVVTNSDDKDVKVREAGFGSKHVDMAVPGEDILTTNDGISKYSLVSGTSLSAPILAGSISLLHSMECASFTEDYTNNPGNTTLMLKDILLSSGDPISYRSGSVLKPLSEITVSGNRLNVHNAMLEMTRVYNDCIIKGPLEITSPVSLTEDSFSFRYKTESEENLEVVIFDILGRLLFKTEIPFTKGQPYITVEAPNLLYESQKVQQHQILFVGLIQGKQKTGKGFFYTISN